MNITGFVSYAAYNVAIKYVPIVEEAFYQRNPRSQNPIELNDVIFALHAVVATLVVIVQCFIYEVILIVNIYIYLNINNINLIY